MDTPTNTIYTESPSDHRPVVVAISHIYESFSAVSSVSKWSISQERIPRNRRRIEVHKIPFGKKMLIRRERIFLPVTKSECGNYFMVESEDLDMRLSEETLEDLKDAFDSVLRMLWKRYVMKEHKKMTPGALELRNHLKATYSCVEYGS